MICIALNAACGLCAAQVPAGTIAGVVRDRSGGAIAGAKAQAVSRATGAQRTTTSGEHGEYSFPALLTGEYEVSVDAAGFNHVSRAVTVESGTTTRADVILDVGSISDLVTVQSASVQLHRDSATVGGLITHDQIEGLPLNGRGFLELAKLEPGLQLPSSANRNRTVVPVLSAPGSNIGGVRVTVDGGSVTSIGLGGSQMGFSQEAVQQFQVSTVNFDLSAGMTHAGVINIVTRSGSNALHAAAFYFFRHHSLSAYPALTRDQDDPDPYFQRQQFGFALGGPIRRNRLFYFANWERNDQRAVAATTLLAPDFAHFSRLTANPLRGDLLGVRLDVNINTANNAFVRHSYDGSRAFGPAATITGGSPNAYPSNWNRVVTRADQSLAGLTTVLRSSIVNDLRVSYFVVTSRQGAASQRDCAGCLGVGAPAISIPQAGLLIGSSTATDNLERRIHLADAVTWQGAAHRARVGIDWEIDRDRNLIWNNEPVALTLFSPDQVRTYNARSDIPVEQRIPLPAAIRTVDEILQLPLQSMMVGVGDPGVRQQDGSPVRRWNVLWLYAEDAWRARDQLTVTCGLGWGIDGGILNHDLRKPLLLEPILGTSGLGPTRTNWTNFSPNVGVAWTPASNGKTVIRAAAGRFYGPQGLTSSMNAERVALGPPGIGRQIFAGSSIFNSLDGIPGVPVGTPLNFRSSPTLFTGANLIAMLPEIRASLARSLANANPAVQQIEISKQQSAPAIFPETVPNPSAVHVNVGLQRELARDFVFSADIVYRHFTHVPDNGGAIDVNHFNSIRGPVIPACTAALAADPRALCSLGPMTVQTAPYRYTYSGLLTRLEKRLSNGFQLLGSYAYSHSVGTHAGTGFNLDDWLQNTGPSGVTHVLNVAGAWRMPWQVDIGFNFSYSSAPPFSAFVGGIDFNGDGTTDDLLPGTTVNAFNRRMGRSDLERLVDDFNRTYAGSRDSHGAAIPRLTLPAVYSFDDNFHTLDIRLSRSIPIRHGVRLAIIGEAFNVYNASNLSGYSGDLTSASFGQPTSRLTQTFGSGGPRSFQLATRMGF